MANKAYFMDVNGNVANFHNSGGSLTANLLAGIFTESATGTTATTTPAADTQDTMSFGSSSVASTTAGTLTLDGTYNIGGFLTRNLTGSATVNGLSGSYLGQRITGANTLNFGSGSSVATLNGNSIFIDPSTFNMSGTLTITSADAASVATPPQPSATGVNFSGTGTSGVTGNIVLNSGFFKLVNNVNSQSFLSTGATVNMNVAGYTVMVQRWAAGLTTATVNGTFTGPGSLRMQGDVNPNIVSFTGSLTGITGSMVIYLSNTVSTVSLPAGGSSYLGYEGSATTDTLTVSNVSSATYLPGGIQFFITGTGGRLNSSGAGFTVGGGIINSSSTAKTLILGGTATGNTISGNASIPGGGALSLTKADAGTWRLAGNNSAMTGAVNVTGGTVQAALATSLGSGAVTMSSGTSMELDGGFTFANTLNGMGNIRSLAGATTISSAITLAGATTIRADAGSLLLSNTGTWTGTNGLALTVGNAADSGGIEIRGVMGANSISTLTKNSSALLTLTATTSAFTGAVTLNGGTTDAAALAPSGSASSIGAGSSVVFTGNSVLRYSGSTPVVFDRALTFTSNTTGAGFENNATGPLTVQPASFSLSGTNKFTLAGSNADYNVFTAQIGSGDSFAKSGAGRWILTANNNPTSGTTNVTGGTLVASNANGTSRLFGYNVTVGSTGKIQPAADESSQKGKCRYQNLTFAGAAGAGNQARIRIGGSAISPTVYITGTLTIPAGGMNWDLSADVFKSPGTYTLVQFGPSGALSGSLSNVTVTGLVSGRSAGTPTYNAGPKTITITIS